MRESDNRISDKLLITVFMFFYKLIICNHFDV